MMKWYRTLLVMVSMCAGMSYAHAPEHDRNNMPQARPEVRVLPVVQIVPRVEVDEEQARRLRLALRGAIRPIVPQGIVPAGGGQPPLVLREPGVVIRVPDRQ